MAGTRKRPSRSTSWQRKRAQGAEANCEAARAKPTDSRMSPPLEPARLTDVVDEPRRSGRATKGQHTKMQETPEPELKKGKGKQQKVLKKQNEQETEEAADEEEEDKNAIVRCVCGTDDEGGMMICCETCEAWQHTHCMGVPDADAEREEFKYYCEQCAPHAHGPLLEAMKKGEKPWEEAARRKEEAKNKKGKKKAGRASNVQQAPTPPPKETPRASSGPDASAKRKHDVLEGTDGPPSKQRKPSTPAAHEAETTKAKGRKSDPGPVKPAGGRKAAAAAAAATAAASPVESVKKIDDLSPEARKSVAGSIKKKIVPVIDNLISKGSYQPPQGFDADSLGEQQAILVEWAMYTNHAGDQSNFAGEYRACLLRLMPNMEKNPELVLHLLTNEISPDALSKMSAEEMASEEHRQKIASMKEELEKQSILPTQTLPRIRRTHKGDEYIDDEKDQHISESSAKASAGVAGAQASQPENKLQNGHTQSPVDGPSPRERRASSNFNINQVWSNVQSPDGTQAPKASQARHPVKRQVSQAEHDADIDRLLDNEGGDSAPYLPSDIEAQDSICWRGNVDMPSTASFTAFAQHVAGSNLQERVQSLSHVFPKVVDIRGRIASDRADQYLCGLSSSYSTDVSVFRLQPSHGDHAASEGFKTLYEYFHDRQRYGVVFEQTHRENVRDVYIVPYEVGGSSQPPLFLQRLDYNVLENASPGRYMLVVFVLKWKTGESTNATPVAQTAPGMSPAGLPPRPDSGLNPHGYQKSPVPQANALGHQTSPAAAQAPPAPHQYAGAYPPQHGLPAHPPYHAPPAPTPQMPSVREVAYNTLGAEMFNSSVVQRIMNGVQEISQEQLANLKSMFLRNPLAMTSWEEFTKELNPAPGQASPA